MTIQIPNVGTGVPADQTGDSPWLAMKKVAENFDDQTNAASRLVGTSTGNVMEVGTFGVGANYQIQSEVLLKDQHINGFGSALITTGAVPADAPNSQIGKVLYIGDPTWGSQVWFSYNNSKVYFRNREVGAEYESWKEFYHSGTSNLQSDSIQAGIGAPKIAYKKLTGTFHNSGGRMLIPHGLDVLKILDVSVFVSVGIERFPPNYSDAAAVNYKVYTDITYIKIDDVNASVLHNNPLTILITYEV